MKGSSLALAIVALLAATLVQAEPGQQHTRDGVRALRAERIQQWRDGHNRPTGAQQRGVLSNVAYGSDKMQKMDIYLPAQPEGAPIVMMVHGGGWRRGDKTSDGVAEAKAARWVPRGAIVASINYRLLPASVEDQARDVASAAKFLQQHAAQWGGDGRKLILMGHSAGAHLVALVGADTARWDISPVLGTVALDSATLDVPGTMAGRHFDLHDDAFGSDPATWRRLSPYHALSASHAPMLMVCSGQRATSCGQARQMQARSRQLGRQSEVLQQDKSHGQINHDLGRDEPYTRQVEAFLQKLDPRLG